MNIWTIREDMGYYTCHDCAGQDFTPMAAWWSHERPDSGICESCRGPVEWDRVDTPKGMHPPTKPRRLTTAETRLLGWRCDGDQSCEFCDLYEMDGEYPVCEDCYQCSECGHADDCEIGDES